MTLVASTAAVDHVFALVMAFLLMSWVAWHIRDEWRKRRGRTVDLYAHEVRPVCHCGQYVDQHTQSDNHAAVTMKEPTDAK